MTPACKQHQSVFPGKNDRTYWLLVALLFVGGALARLSLPLTPFSDPDVMGYLKPSLIQATTGVFTHVGGRNFLYPSFVSCVLQVTGSFNAISLIQHSLGLLAAGLMMAVWHQMVCFFPLSPTSRIVHRVLGLAILTSFLFTRTSYLMEHSIRPEAVFPFFTVAAVFLACRYFIALRERRGAGIIFALGCAIVYNAFIVYSLKPAFGLAVGVAILPVLISLRLLKWPFAGKAALLAAPLYLVAVTLWLPEKKLIEAYDKGSDSFLPELLIAFHANIIRNEMDAELHGRAQCPFDKELVKTSLALIDQELQHPGARYRASLGFDADNLIYKHSLVEALKAYYKTDGCGFNQFCMHYYLAAWKHQPGKMITKVGRQMWNFWGGQFGAFDNQGGLPILVNERAARSLECLDWVDQPCPSFDHYLAANRTLLTSKQEWKQHLFMRLLHGFFNNAYFPLFLLTTAGAIGLAWKRPRQWAKANQLDRAILWTAYLFLFSFGNCLTVAIIHTTQVSRYTKNQLIFTLLAEASAILLVSILVEKWRERRAQSLSAPAIPCHPDADI